MVALTLLCTLAGLGLVLSGMARGELGDHRPSGPEPRWRLVVGAMVFVGGTLLTVVTLAVPRLVPQRGALSVGQPVGSSRGTIEPVSALPGTFR